MSNILLTPYTKKGLSLQNHLVMAPMTRSRALGNIPNALMAEYYGQRIGAGLIVTEGAAPLPEGLGYARIPGIFSKAQVEGWKRVTAAVHKGKTKFFMQLMHVGRIGHIDNLPKGVHLVGVSSVKAAGQIFTDIAGMQDHSTPVALTTEGVKQVIAGYIIAAQNAIESGFDGVELHGANGYLIEQFLNPHVNTRTDEYGGTIENRARFAIEVAEGVAKAIGKEKVGIRFSPFSILGDLQPYDEKETHETYEYLAKALEKIGIVYIHIAKSPKAPKKIFDAIRTAFSGTIIICNGFTPETGEAALSGHEADLIAFGRSFLANPDLDKRIEAEEELQQPDFTTLYTADAKGYTDYPFLP